MIRQFLFPAVVGLAVYYAVFGGEYSIFEVRATRAEAREAATELVELEQVVDSLAERAEKLENDPATLEKLARESFGMIREGEVLYRFADSEEDQADPR